MLSQGRMMDGDHSIAVARVVLMVEHAKVGGGGGGGSEYVDSHAYIILFFLFLFKKGCSIDHLLPTVNYININSSVFSLGSKSAQYIEALAFPAS